MTLGWTSPQSCKCLWTRPCAISAGREHLGGGDVLALAVLPDFRSVRSPRPSGRGRECLSLPCPAVTCLLTVAFTCILLMTKKAGSHFMLTDPVVSLPHEGPVQDFCPLLCKVAHWMCVCVRVRVYSVYSSHTDKDVLPCCLLSEQCVVMNAVPQFDILHV